MDMIPKVEELFDLAYTEHADIFSDVKYPWEALPLIAEYIEYYFTQHPPRNNAAEYDGAHIGKEVILGEGTVVMPGATIVGPAIIGENCTIRPGAFIRENVIIGNDSLIGNSTEVKNSLLFHTVEAAHMNYIGDSILGHKAHLGAGAKISNVKIPMGEITVATHYQKYKTGLHKFGALIGDFCEIGSNSVLNPATIMGKNSIVYPLTSFRGILPESSIVKTKQTQEIIAKRR